MSIAIILKFISAILFILYMFSKKNYWVYLLSFINVFGLYIFFETGKISVIFLCLIFVSTLMVNKNLEIIPSNFKKRLMPKPYELGFVISGFMIMALLYTYLEGEGLFLRTKVINLGNSRQYIWAILLSLSVLGYSTLRGRND